MPDILPEKGMLDATEENQQAKYGKPSGAELVNPYGDGSHKAEEVERMFDSIAPAYDFMNTAMTFGLHRCWRNRAMNAAVGSRNGLATERVLDVATGTGDLAFDLLRRFPNAAVTGVDLSEGMLKIAEEKRRNLDETEKKRLSFEKGDSLDLDFPDDTFQLVTVAYGVRNFERLAEGIREMHRVLGAGGTLCVIELSEPKHPLTHALYRFYSRRVIPAIGRRVSGDSRAYTYLPESIAAAPQRDDMRRIILDAGFESCTWKSLTFGAVTYYIARKGGKS